MALEQHNNVSSLESVQKWNLFQLTKTVQIAFFNNVSFEEWNVIEILERTDKTNDSWTISIHYRVHAKWTEHQDRSMSLWVFIYNFDQKVVQIEKINNVAPIISQTTQEVDQLISNA
jgi:hypothetical protein